MTGRSRPEPAGAPIVAAFVATAGVAPSSQQPAFGASTVPMALGTSHEGVTGSRTTPRQARAGSGIAHRPSADRACAKPRRRATTPRGARIGITTNGTVGSHQRVSVATGTFVGLHLAVFQAEILLRVLEERFDAPPRPAGATHVLGQCVDPRYQDPARRASTGNSGTKKHDSPSGCRTASPVLSWSSQTDSRTRSSCSRI